MLVQYTKLKKGQAAGTQAGTSDHLMFVEELFSLVTLKTYSSNNDIILET
jgi:hypothetical protein